MDKNLYMKDLVYKFKNIGEEKVAFSLYDGEKVTDVTYGQFAEDIYRTAGYFVEQQIKNKHVAIAAQNSYRWLTVFFALVVTGNKVILLNQDLPADILQQQCEMADVSLVCYQDCEMVDKIKMVPLLQFDAIYGECRISETDFCEQDQDETLIMMFTSGTTGKSKVVEITSGNVWYSMKNLDPSYEVKGMERLFTPIPFYHIAGLTTVLEAFNQEKTECIGRGMRHIFADMPMLNPTTINAVPSIVESLLKIFKRAKTHEERAKYVGNSLSLICVSGAVLRPSVSKFIKEQNIEISVYYGMTEITGAATWTMLEEDNLGVTGKFCKYAEYCFKDGELLLKGPTLMKGYYKDPEETEKVIGDGWIHTGDMGYCDEDGILYLTGRKKNVIILSNGENVNPEEVEAFLGECNQVEECMVYSDGKGICADIYTKNLEVVSAFVRKYNEEVPMYRQIYKINYSENPLPKTGSGKIKRKGNL